MYRAIGPHCGYRAGDVTFVIFGSAAVLLRLSCRDWMQWFRSSLSEIACPVALENWRHRQKSRISAFFPTVEKDRSKAPQCPWVASPVLTSFQILKRWCEYNSDTPVAESC